MADAPITKFASAVPPHRIWAVYDSGRRGLGIALTRRGCLLTGAAAGNPTIPIKRYQKRNYDFKTWRESLSYCLTITNNFINKHILRRVARDKLLSSLEKIVQTQPRILITTESALWTQILYRDHVPVKDCRPWYMNFAAHSQNCIIQINPSIIL